MFRYVVENSSLLADQEMQHCRLIGSYAEHNARGLQKVIHQLVQLPKGLSGMITMQKHNHRVAASDFACKPLSLQVILKFDRCFHCTQVAHDVILSECSFGG